MPEVPSPIRAPELATGLWLQGPRVSIAAERGRVVLIDFWEASCVYCLRTLPYVVAWHERYAARGLTIVGVHTPEFDFTGSPAFVSAAASEQRITYPLLLDVDRNVWSSYANRVWPAKYLVDARGYVRFEHFGEGGYGVFEDRIQRLLREAGDDSPMPDLLLPLRPEDAPGAVCHRATEEIYVGFHRGRLASSEGYRPDEVVAHAIEQPDPRAGTFVARGAWLHADDYLEARETGASLTVACEASSMFFVAEPEGWCRVELDGAPIAEEIRGVDVAEVCNGTVAAWDRPRLVELLDAPDFGPRRVRLTAFEPGLRIYTFTFGGCLSGSA